MVDDWAFGRRAAHDWVVTHVCQKLALKRQPPSPNLPLEIAEDRKISYARGRCERRGVEFLPLVADSFGGFSPVALGAISRVAKEARLRRGRDADTTISNITQRLQVALFKGVARQLLRRVVHREFNLEDDQ